MSRRSYKGSSQATSLTAPINSSAVAATVADGSTLPDGATAPFVLTLDLGLAGEEKVLCTSRTGNNLVIGTRGYDGTTAAAHAAGASVRHTISAVDLDEANAHHNAATTHTDLTVGPSASGSKALIVKGVASQSADLTEWQNSSGTVLSLVDKTGTLKVGTTSRLYSDADQTTGTVTYAAYLSTAAVGVKPLLVQGMAGQTANLTEWQNSAGTALLAVTKDGTFGFDTSLSFSSVGGAGGASALPATPAGYIGVNVGGAFRRIPYYL